MTEFLIGGRGTGKSQEAIKWVRGAGNRYLVIPDSRQVDHLLAMDRANVARRGGMALHPDKFIPYHAAATRRGMGQAVEYGVDNLDMLLQQIFGRYVAFVTATGSLHSAPESETNSLQIGVSE